jgi:hypothetical protein
MADGAVGEDIAYRLMDEPGEDPYTTTENSMRSGNSSVKLTNLGKSMWEGIKDVFRRPDTTGDYHLMTDHPYFKPNEGGVTEEVENTFIKGAKMVGKGVSYLGEKAYYGAETLYKASVGADVAYNIAKDIHHTFLEDRSKEQDDLPSMPMNPHQPPSIPNLQDNQQPIYLNIYGGGVPIDHREPPVAKKRRKGHRKHYTEKRK